MKCCDLRYEWSVGESHYDTPFGVFDVIEDKIWHESGPDMFCMLTVYRGKCKSLFDCKLVSYKKS